MSVNYIRTIRIRAISVALAGAFSLFSIYSEGAFGVVWTLMIFLSPFLWLLSRKRAVIPFCVNVLLLGLAIYLGPVRRYILSKSELLVVSDVNYESADNPFVFTFLIAIGINMYFIAKMVMTRGVNKPAARTQEPDEER